MITLTPNAFEPPHGVLLPSNPDTQKPAIGFDQIMQALYDEVPALKELNSRMTGNLRSDSAALGTALRDITTFDQMEEAVAIFLDEDTLSVTEAFRHILSVVRGMKNPLFDKLDRLEAAVFTLEMAQVHYSDPEMRDMADIQIKELQAKVQMVKDQIADETLIGVWEDEAGEK